VTGAAGAGAGGRSAADGGAPVAPVDGGEPVGPVDAGERGLTGFAVFAFCFALSGLLDVAPYHGWLDSPFHLPFALACAAVLWRPGSLVAFAVMNALRLAVFVHDSPDNANHHVLHAVAAATLLAALPFAARAAGGLRRLGGEGWRACFAPALRAELLALYFVAVLHKLNRDYLDPEVSCAVFTLLGVVPGFAGEWLAADPTRRAVLVWGSLAAETAIPLLLALRRTRPLGIAAGVLFHTFLGIRFFAFSTGLLAFYSLFAPAALFAELDSALRRWRARGWLPRLALSGVGVRAAALALVAAMGWAAATLRMPGGRELPRLGFPVLAGAWVAGVLAAVAAALLAAGSRGWREPAPGRLRAAPLLALFPLLVVANGLSPYLGLRTVPTFSMFSNLRTEGGRTNHLFVPATALRVASWQEDLVTVIEAEDEELRRFARRPRRTFYDFARRIQKLAREGKTGIRVTYRRGGERIALTHAERDAALMRRFPWWQRKWLRFRPVSRAPRQECSW
jgi:hypothetical protein